MTKPLSYRQAGVDIDVADATKRDMAKALASNDPRVLNRIGAFASLFDARFPEYKHPVLVLKTEEPGSKQKLALQNGHAQSICYDLINHLVNDIIVMGATPLSVQDAIICGKLEKETVGAMVATIAQACREQGCSLTGGETSEQPGVLEAGTYILTASIVGVVEKDRIIDGAKIELGDSVLAIASNGLHTNGYSLARALMAQRPEILQEKVDGLSFLESILLPHTCYYPAVRGLFDEPGLHGMAHITGGGVQDNLNRVLPPTVNAAIDRAAIRILPVFKLIRRYANVSDDDMLRTFNMGVGMTIVVSPCVQEKAMQHIQGLGLDCYPIGQIVPGEKKIAYHGQLQW